MVGHSTEFSHGLGHKEPRRPRRRRGLTSIDSGRGRSRVRPDPGDSFPPPGDLTHDNAEDRKGWLFRTSHGHNATVLSEQPMNQSDAWSMIRRRAAAAGIHAPIGNHTFRATGITAYLSNGGALEHAQEMAAHESPRSTKLYDRTKERLTQDEVERIRL